MSQLQIPYCLAMVLCEAVHRCPVTGKFTILGTFNRVNAIHDSIVMRFCVYFAVTDGVGKCDVGIRIVDSRSLLDDDESGDEPLLMANAPVDFVDPLAVIEGVMGLQVVFPSTGVYHCELFVGDEVLMSRRLVVSKPNAESVDDG